MTLRFLSREALWLVVVTGRESKDWDSHCPIFFFEDSSLILLIAFEQISGNMATEHVNGNGTEEPMDATSAVIHSENFQTLLDAGLP